ncbi:MAG: NCS2 family permease, partial [Eggerthellaceae bacterium]|nr:NCS2 family permease [Eggerthellaceae bacterium]
MDKFFKISERGSTVSTEIIGGLTTFLAMSYIIAVNPSILGAAGVPFNAALTATCFGAALMTIVMGLFANRPIALASGMGINAVVAFGLCLGMNVDWHVAMAIIFLEGVLILILVLCGLREAIMNAIPASLRRAIAIGIGLFIAFIGLKGGGIVASDESTFLTLGTLTSPVAIVAIVSILVAIVLTALKVKGGLLISIVVATIVGIPLGVTVLPTTFNFAPDFSSFGAPFQLTPDGVMGLAQVFIQPALLMFVFSLLMSDFFDTVGTVVAVGSQGDFVDKDDNVEDIKQILIVDSAAAAVGGLAGASSITSYIESISGVASGARTGLSNLVIGIAFVIFTFLAPVVGMVSSAATCGALVVVGYLMMSDIGEIDWKEPSLA